MKILITGANGFLGQYLVKQSLLKNHIVIATGRGASRLPAQASEQFVYQQMDFTDPFAVHDVFEKFQPDIVIHAGAMSKPDECEKNQWQAYVENVESTITLILNSEEQKAFFIFISTDFVFDGESGPYKENDRPNPVNFYGKTKLEAEEAVEEYPFSWAIVRTVLVYGKPHAGGANLLTIVKEKIGNGEEYQVFDDQIRTPTYVEDLARAILSICEKKATGVFHISGKDVLTPYQMACMMADQLHLDKSLIKKISAPDLVQPAKRPPRTGFIIDKARRELSYEPISFEEGLRKTFQVSSE